LGFVLIRVISWIVIFRRNFAQLTGRCAVASHVQNEPSLALQSA